MGGGKEIGISELGLGRCIQCKKRTKAKNKQCRDRKPFHRVDLLKNGF
jgi:hypothetical protein